MTTQPNSGWNAPEKRCGADLELFSDCDFVSKVSSHYPY